MNYEHTIIFGPLIKRFKISAQHPHICFVINWKFNIQYQIIFKSHQRLFTIILIYVFMSAIIMIHIQQALSQKKCVLLLSFLSFLIPKSKYIINYINDLISNGYWQAMLMLKMICWQLFLPVQFLQLSKKYILNMYRIHKIALLHSQKMQQPQMDLWNIILLRFFYLTKF